MVAEARSAVHDADLADLPALTRQQIVDQILTINRAAAPGWLEQFTPSALWLYLEHLQKTVEPRGRGSRWVRRGDTPAIVRREGRED